VFVIDEENDDDLLELDIDEEETLIISNVRSLNAQEQR